MKRPKSLEALTQLGFGAVNSHITGAERGSLLSYIYYLEGWKLGALIALEMKKTGALGDTDEG